MGLRVWSGGEIFSKKINKKWRAHNAPPPIITKVKIDTHTDFHEFLRRILGDMEENPQKIARGFLSVF